MLRGGRSALAAGLAYLAFDALRAFDRFHRASGRRVASLAVVRGVQCLVFVFFLSVFFACFLVRKIGRR